MKTSLPTQIKTIDEAKAFLCKLHSNGEAFHPEDDASTIVGDPFTQAEATQLNKLMQDVYNLPGNDGRSIDLAFDPCEFILMLEDTDRYEGFTLKNDGFNLIVRDCGFFEVENTEYTVSDLNNGLLIPEARENSFAINQGETEVFKAYTWKEISEKLNTLINPA